MRPSQRRLRAILRAGGVALGASVGFTALAAGAAARAETLADAIALAYRSNPALQSQRAQLRAVDETYVQAKAGAGPTAQIQATESYDRTNQPISALLPPSQIGTTTTDAEFTISQPIYSGGRTAAAVDVARARIAAGRAQLSIAEGDVMLAVIQAYADVLRDQQALEARRKHLDMLTHQLDIANARREAGEGTITDVAQAEAQLAEVRALMTDAQNQVQVSRAAYATVVGQNPGDLAPAPDLPGLPASADEAFTLAEAASPDLQQAERSEDISRAQAVAARVAYRPSLSVNGTAGYAVATQPYFGRMNDWNVSALVTLSVPLFTNGLAASGVRQALEQDASARIGIETARRAMVQNVANAWNRMITARAGVALQREQVRAASAAFEGMQIEYNAGMRSTLDVLIAEGTLRNAELSLLGAQHDQYVAAATLLRYVGRLEGGDLVTNLPGYDPDKHLKQVRNAGMVPWTGLVAGIDRIALPGARPKPIPTPPRASAPRSAQAGATIPADAPLATAVPTTPLPNSASAKADPIDALIRSAL